MRRPRAWWRLWAASEPGLQQRYSRQPTREARGRVPHVSKPTECRASAAGALRRAALREAVLRNEWRPRTAPGGAGGLARPGSSTRERPAGQLGRGSHDGAARRPSTSNRDPGRGRAVPGPGRDPGTRSRAPRRTNSKAVRCIIGIQTTRPLSRRCLFPVHLSACPCPNRAAAGRNAFRGGRTPSPPTRGAFARAGQPLATNSGRG